MVLAVHCGAVLFSLVGIVTAPLIQLVNIGNLALTKGGGGTFVNLRGSARFAGALRERV